MDIREIAKEVWTKEDVKDMLVNIMDLAKSGSLKHADYVFKVMTYEPKADVKGQLQIPFENLTLNIVHGDKNNGN